MKIRKMCKRNTLKVNKINPCRFFKTKSRKTMSDILEAQNQLNGAAQQDSLELFEIALKRKAKINYQDGVGNTALHYACMSGSIVVLEQLLNKMPDNLVYIKNIQGNTPLHCLMDTKHSPELIEKMTTLLLKHNPLIMSRNKDGMTVVDLATGDMKEKLHKIALTKPKSPAGKKKGKSTIVDKRDLEYDSE
eukprot:NODE_93_length_21530_cov_0.700387.p14 type:complete len:191 gc:universal NODE_93_length_21530_cov_0.700387:7549-8121(+)